MDYKPEPNFQNLLSVLRHEKPERPTLFEFYMNWPLYQKHAGPLPADCPDDLVGPLMTTLAFKNLGYDYASIVLSEFEFKVEERATGASWSMNEGSVIHDRATFEAYAWPDPDAISYDVLERIEPYMPEGMKWVLWGYGGVLENVTALVGYENLCIMLMEEEDLAQDIFDAVGSRFLRYYQNALQYDAVGAIISNDDWGFRTQTLFSPAQLRRFVFPWHRKIAQAAHDAGRPAILHSCGELREVWDEIIDDMKFDGKHSYEDAILPVEQAYEKYGHRIGILGGIDVDFVCRSSTDAVYRRAAALVEQTSDRGGYGLGTGNSIPEYVPEDHYLAMTRAVREKHNG